MQSKALPENFRIDVYESPHGKGYQIYYEENGVAHSVGYGAEAADRTYTIEFPKPAPSAASRLRVSIGGFIDVDLKGIREAYETIVGPDCAP